MFQNSKLILAFFAASCLQISSANADTFVFRDFNNLNLNEGDPIDNAVPGIQVQGAILAVPGEPFIGLVSVFGIDTVEERNDCRGFPIGGAFITDALGPNGEVTKPGLITITFTDGAVSNLIVHVLDLEDAGIPDTSEDLVARAYDSGGNLIEIIEISAGDPDTGDGRATRVQFTKPNIAEATFFVDGGVSNNAGWGIDNLHYTLPHRTTFSGSQLLEGDQVGSTFAGVDFMETAIFVNPGSPAFGFFTGINGDDTVFGGQQINGRPIDGPFIADQLGPGGSPTITSEIRMRFEEPAYNVGVAILDIDGVVDQMTARAFDADEQLLEEIVIDAGDPNTGDGIATPVTFTAPAIVEATFIVVREGNQGGWGLDNLEFSTVNTVSTETNAEVLIPLRGNYSAGELSSTFESDDQYLEYEPGLTLSNTEPPVWLEFKSTLPCDNPTAISFRLEARVNTPGIRQTIKLYNFEIGVYENADIRFGTTDDKEVNVTIDDNASRFVKPETGEVRARLNWFPVGPLILFPWTVSIDDVAWSVTE